MEWKPITSAPKDGSIILIYKPAKNNYQACGVFVCKWVEKPRIGYIWAMHNGASVFHDSEITHWMLLPKPPKTE